MSDDLGLFADDAGEPPPRGRRADRDRLRRRRRRRIVTAMAGIFVLLIVGAAALYGTRQLLTLGSYEDYKGNGTGHVVIEVERGDTTSAIGRTLANKDVVASAAAFVIAARGNEEVSGIQPGFYMMRSKMSGAAAVRRILSEEARVGQVEIRGGLRLDDQVRPDGTVVPGILSKLAAATCVGDRGPDECVSSKEMHAAAASVDLAGVGVPQWAVGPASKAPKPERRLEGLILPGIYHVRPTADAKSVLRSVLTASARKMQAVGLPDIAEGTGFSAYEIMVIASLVQSEAVREDFDKVSRVIRNRLQTDMRLQFDSTINYTLDRPTLATDDADRKRPGPYNTYLNTGLPPTPISSPSKAAIKAAVNPAEGNWKYFVRCHKDGRSCFSKTYEQHLKAVDKARARGAF